ESGGDNNRRYLMPTWQQELLLIDLQFRYTNQFVNFWQCGDAVVHRRWSSFMFQRRQRLTHPPYCRAKSLVCEDDQLEPSCSKVVRSDASISCRYGNKRTATIPSLGEFS